MLLQKQKKNHAGKGNRLLISITVMGSAGPIRFVVNEEELVAAVIVTALKSYVREGRLPVLGSDLNDFLLYCPLAGIEALSPWIGGGEEFHALQEEAGGREGYPRRQTSGRAAEEFGQMEGVVPQVH